MKSLKQILGDGGLTHLFMQAFQCLLLNTDAMIFIKDANLVYQAANMPFVRLCGKERIEDILGHTDFEIFENQELAKRYVADDFRLFESGKNEVSFNEPLPELNGRARYGRTSKYVLRDEQGKIIGITGISREITPEIVLVEQDEQTGLLSRASLMEYMGNFIRDAGCGHSHAMFLLDIDNFKKINDTYGHRAGDRFLAHIAKSIVGCFRDTDLVGRVGGDEFVVLMKYIPGRRVVEEKAAALLKAIQNSCDNVEHLEVSASIGVSLYPQDSTTLEELFELADAAMYRAKRSGKNRAVFSMDKDASTE